MGQNKVITESFPVAAVLCFKHVSIIEIIIRLETGYPRNNFNFTYRNYSKRQKIVTIGYTCGFCLWISKRRNIGNLVSYTKLKITNINTFEDLNCTSNYVWTIIRIKVKILYILSVQCRDNQSISFIKNRNTSSRFIPCLLVYSSAWWLISSLNR